MPPTSVPDADYTAFVHRVRAMAGVNLGGYKPDQMQRRLQSLAARHGADTLVRFAEQMERDPKALAAFKDFFTINVSEFLRDPLRWRELSAHILAPLYQENGRRPLKVWSAGCSYGAEPYSLAMLLEELGPGAAHTIIGTDIDATILQRAQCGVGYTEADLRHVEGARRTRFFTREADGTYSVKSALKRITRFQRRDLLVNVPDRGLDLIVCRNVVIYFTDEARCAIYKRMSAALRPGGVLFVGGTEIVAGARDLGFEPFRTSFYRKAGGQRAAPLRLAG